MFKGKELGLAAALLLFGVSVAFCASMDMSLLKTGKTWTGTISGFPHQKGGHSIPKRDVTLQLENIGPSSAKVQISWSKFYDGSDKPGSEACEAQIQEEMGLPKLSCKTKNGNFFWEFTFHPDGQVHCRLDFAKHKGFWKGYLK
jgi:hypothetical protein